MCELKHTYYAYTKVVGLLDATCAHASAGNSLKLDTHTHTHTRSFDVEYCGTPSSILLKSIHAVGWEAEMKSDLNAGESISKSGMTRYHWHAPESP